MTTPRPVTGLDAALAELRQLRAELERIRAPSAPTRGWDRLRETEWPFFALLFYADAETRLAALARSGSRLRERATADARWALERARRIGIPGAIDIAGVAPLPDGHRLLALERFARVAGEGEHEEERERLAAAFVRSFERSPTGILASYPRLWWTLDSVPALAALRLRGHEEPARKWEGTVRRYALDERTGLVRAAFDGARPRAIGPPRGSALMLALPDLAVAAPTLAEEQWRAARTHLVRTLHGVGLTGVRELPESVELPASDDSGRIVMGLGEAASGLALAAAAAMHDLDLLARLLRSARLVAPPVWHEDRLALGGVPPVGQAAMLRAKVWSAITLDL